MDLDETLTEGITPTLLADFAVMETSMVGTNISLHAQLGFVEALHLQRRLNRQSNSNNTGLLQVQHRSSDISPSPFVSILYPPDDPKGRLLFQGHVSEGRRNGHGLLIWSDGTAYEGLWKDDKMNGKGTMRWPSSNSTYIGDWQDNAIQGEGTITWSTTNVRYTGQWKNGLREGFGTMTFSPDDSVRRLSYTGEWKADERNGKGMMLWRNGAKYEGEWKSGRRDGVGVHTFPNGVRYSGSWRGDDREGKGKLYFTNGDVFKGEWIKDQKHGMGTYFCVHGRVRYLWYNHGEKVKECDFSPRSRQPQTLATLCVETVVDKGVCVPKHCVPEEVFERVLGYARQTKGGKELTGKRNMPQTV
ncbi:Alsin [Balamuthia mandrillaris]